MPHFGQIRPGWAFFLALVLALPSRLAAQQLQIRGIALDDQTREPVAAASIQLIDTNGNRLLATLTDAQGRFQLTVPGSGRYRVRGERLGYFANQTAELSGAALTRLIELRMSPQPVRLDSILVSARSEARPLRAGEQLIHGRLIEDETQAAIPGGTIELYSKGRRLLRTMSDANGLFRVVTPLPGSYTLRAERIGYKSAESPELKLILGDTIRLDFSLSARAVLLAPIVITGSAREWVTRREQNGMEDFNKRLKRYGNSAFGDFVTRDSLAAYERNGYTVKQIIELHFYRRAETCRPAIDVYVNGAPFFFDPRDAASSPVVIQKLDDAFSPATLEAAELYTAPTIPGEFIVAPIGAAARANSYAMPCHVIALWTRR